MTAGLQLGDLIIIAGRPAMGKTAFSLNIAEYVAQETNHSVAFFSMGMRSKDVFLRLLASVGRLDLYKLRSGNMTDNDRAQLARALSQLSKLDLHIVCTTGLTAMEVCTSARRLAGIFQTDKSLGLIVVDHLQLMIGNGIDQARKTSDICHAFKKLAEELHVPVLVLSQLSRAPEYRQDHRPEISHLMNPEVIAQVADTILFIYRDEVYNPDSSEPGGVEIIVGKQRNGPLGTVRLNFRGECLRFENCDINNGERRSLGR